MSQMKSIKLPPMLGEVSRPMAALLSICRGEPATAFLSADPSDARRLLALASHHGQLGALLLAAEQSGQLTAEQSKTLLFLRRQAALWDLERDAVMTRLAEAGLPAVLLKGAALRITAYRDPAERPFGDIDVLVPDDRLDDATHALGALGYTGQPTERAQLYRAHHHHFILDKPPGFKVEVHWGLLPVRYPLRLDPAAFLRSAVTVKGAGGQPLRVPRPEHMVLHVAVQNVEDHFAKLRRLVDIHRVIMATPAFDWDWLASEARHLRLESVTALSLRLTELLLGTQLPPGYIRHLGAPALSRLHLARLDPVGLLVDGVEQPRTSVQRLLLVWSIASERDRVRFVRDLLTGRADWFWRAVEHDGNAGGFRWHDLMAFGKTALYQLSCYPVASGRRRAGVFWGG